jgi:hypothetical protein
MGKKLLLLLVSLSSMVISLILAEMILRILDYKPWSYSTLDSKEPTTLKHDPILGWKHMEGNFIIPPYHPDGKETRITFLKGGVRITQRHENNSRDESDKIIIVGGSYTQGWGISDDETYPWKLQERFPYMKVLNYGTGAYGTYQSLLSLEQILPVTNSPAIVIYGFIQHHEIRNVSPSCWMETLTRFSKRGHVFVPYATINENGVLCSHQPDSYPSWPLREHLTIVSLAEKAFMKLKTNRRKSQKSMVTEQLLIEMQGLCNKYGISFIVAMLSFNEQEKDHYLKFLLDNNIMVADCVRQITPELRIKGEIHPNGKLNSIWAECIADFINNQKLINL